MTASDWYLAFVQAAAMLDRLEAQYSPRPADPAPAEPKPEVEPPAMDRLRVMAPWLFRETS